MKIPTPQEIGLPEKFDKWRPDQEEAIGGLLNESTRVRTVCAGTGFGKSLCLVAIPLINKKPTCIVTPTLNLVKQYMDVFSSIGMVSLVGKNNYTCEMRDDLSCDEGQAARCPYKGTVGCPASQAEMRAASSPLVVTTYAKWTASRAYGTGMAHFQQVIFDEGHEAYDALASAMQVVLNHHEIEDILRIPFISGTDAEDFPNWKPWAAKARVAAEAEMIVAQARITGVSDPKPSWVRHYTHMRNLTRRLATLSTANAAEWVADKVEAGFQFDPIRPGRYSESALLLKVPHVLFGSATIRPKSMFMLHIGKDKFKFAEFNSTFDPKRCPVYFKPTMPVDKNHPDLRMLWVFLDQLAAPRRDRKGIVHTISYAKKDEILATSRFASAMVFNSKGEASAEKIREYLDRGPGAILVSPSVGAGHDFAYRDCEWQFIVKIPFQDSRSKVIKARQDDDKEYGPMVAMQKLVQSCGRPMRYPDDRGETYMGDENLSWFMSRYGHLAPKSFHGRYKVVDTIQPPPPRL